MNEFEQFELIWIDFLFGPKICITLTKWTCSKQRKEAGRRTAKIPCKNKSVVRNSE